MEWIASEMSSLSIGDKRLNARCCQLLKSLSNHIGESIPRACGDWYSTKAAYRFFSNEKVTAESILAPHIASSLSRIKREKRVLFIQDTTELNYSSQQNKQGVGPGLTLKTKTLFLHPTIAVTEQQLCLGVVDDYHWAREKLKTHEYPSKKARRDSLLHQPIENKESYRWLSTYRKISAYQQQCPNTQCIMVGDRECDIYDIFHDGAENTQDLKADWLVRVAHNRCLVDNTGERLPERLDDTLSASSELGQVTFCLPKQGKRAARQVTQQIRMVRVRLSPPTGRRGRNRLEPVEVTVILAEEVNQPEGVTPLRWRLMTNIELNGLEEALQAIQWYLTRWQIEVFFKILKSGCQVEKNQLTDSSRFKPFIAMSLIIAWRVLNLTMLSRKLPEASCEHAFAKEEWQFIYVATKKVKPPSEPPTLIVMTRLLGQLGGFLNRNSDPFPGIKCIWRGIKRLYEMISTKNLLQLMGND